MPTQPAVTPHTILLKGRQGQRYEEARAAAALKPGHLITKNSSGQVLKHATANGGTQVWVALEDELAAGNIDTAYASNDVVPYHIPLPGDMLYCRCAAAATAIPMNGPLTSDGAGGVRNGTVGTHVIIGYAVEAVDNSAGASEAMVKVEWI